ncbi:hypothetical protein, partial [Candidatus Methylobacter oryzae]|uniref:hypothetical protein n=1 Tax=Candidatus Methylobacter oryzae TaxID=2497749 RepID=UPI0019D5BCD8
GYRHVHHRLYARQRPAQSTILTSGQCVTSIENKDEVKPWIYWKIVFVERVVCASITDNIFF